MAETAHNLDINLPERISAQFPQLTKLLDNPEISGRFARSETTANLSKRWFNVFGLSSLVLIILMLLIAAWRPFIHKAGIATPSWLLWVSASAGFASFAMSITSTYVFGFQGKWLLNRFVTERLRQWKFQQLLDGRFVDLSVTNPHEFDSELEKRWVMAQFDVLEKPGTMEDFLDAEDFRLFVRPSVSANTEMARTVADAYQSLRLEYQAKYLSFKKHTLGTLDVWTSGIGKLTFLLAGLTALTEIVIIAFNHSASHESTVSWLLGVLALSLALISVAVRIIRSAKAISEETERYTTKWVLLKTLAERFYGDTDPEKQLECMVETERVCVEELREFIRTFNKSDYLL
jgi:flagellar biogenesis protein FliO